MGAFDGIIRIFRHILLTPLLLDRLLPKADRLKLQTAISEGEKTHAGQLRLCIERALPLVDLFEGRTARQRAMAIFSCERVWDTEQNCGVLLYFLLADRNIEIVADRGISKKVAQAEWEEICKMIEVQIRGGNFAGGVKRGIEAITNLLGKHFPSDHTDNSDHNDNELSDELIIK